MGPSVWEAKEGKVVFKKASEMKPHGKQFEVFADGVDVNDVQQGGLGDCYFLCALSVLSNEDVRKIFIFEDGPEEWKTCGAFCIKFWD